MNAVNRLISAVLSAYPNTQAIYLFGSWSTENEWPTSDVDIALLLCPDEAKKTGSLVMSELRFALEAWLKRDVDLINLRLAPTVLQKEIIMAERQIFCADCGAADEFEMRVLWAYQKLNQERAGILAEGLLSGRFYDV